MGDGGWVKLHRRFVEWEWFKTPNMVHLFTYLLLAANHEDGRWQGVEVKRGQLITGRNDLAEKIGATPKCVRNCLEKLEKTGEIVRRSTNKFSVITICNYDKYQEEEAFKGQQRASKGPAKAVDFQKNGPAEGQLEPLPIVGCKQFAGDQGPAEGQQNVRYSMLGGHKQEEQEVEEERKDIVGQAARPRRNIVPVAEIIDFLNAKAGTDFRATSDDTKKHIKARFAEKFTLEDFKTVIEFKVGEWATDAKMREYLRPKTLFGSKFEGYLQAAKMSPVDNQWGIYGKWKDKEPKQQH